MEKSLLTRQYLESISTSDLLILADDYGIDIPDDLSRRFIIGELLEFAEEDSIDEDDFLEEEQQPSVFDLPASYNETVINVIMRNPAWAFVFWDISEAVLKSLDEDDQFDSLCLRVAVFEDSKMTVRKDSFDIQIGKDDREQYVLIPGGSRFFIVELGSNSESGHFNQLSVTELVEIAQGNESLLNNHPGKEPDCTEMQKLSGMNRLLHDHFNNHRQSFS